MSGITLTILGDAAGVKRAFGQVVTAQRSANAALSAEDRAVNERRRKGYDADAAAAAKAEKEKTKAAAREAMERRRTEERADREKKKIADRAVRDADRAEKEKTKAAEREGKLRARLAAQETRAWESEANERIRSQERAEQRVTRDAERYLRQRKRMRERDAREREANRRAEDQLLTTRVGGVVGVGGAMVGAGAMYAQGAHGMIQGARQTVAMRERSIDNALVQLAGSPGVNAEELRGLRAQIMGGIQARHLNPEAAIEAINAAQSFSNILGGDTREARRANANAALEDVSYAAAINPNNMTGTVKFGGMLRQRLAHTPQGEALRQRIMRSVTGIAFTGSVEEEDALRGGLPALLAAINTQTATARPEDADRITADVVTDFMANLEVASMSGGTSRLNANRSTALRTTFNNNNKVGEIGAALARRQMTDEQRATFNRTWTRDAQGHYALTGNLAQSGAGIASAILPLFGNDPTAVANFMGPGGGGGRHQLLTRPEVGLLNSYAGTVQNAAGQRVRQYQYVEEMKRQTLTPESERVIRELRSGEQAQTLQDENEATLATLTRDGAQQRVSNAVTGIAARNPLGMLGLSAALPALGGVANGIGAIAGLVGLKATALGGTALAAATAGGAALMAANTGRTVDGREVSTMGRLLRGGAMLGGALAAPFTAGMSLVPGMLMGARDVAGVGANAARGTGLLDSLVSALPQSIGNAVAESIRKTFAENPPVVRIPLEELMHAATQNGTGSGATP